MVWSFVEKGLAENHIGGVTSHLHIEWRTLVWNLETTSYLKLLSLTY